MVQLQIISRCILSGDISFIESNNLTAEYFSEYQDEYEYIVDHYKRYGNVPDKSTFLSHFSDENGQPTIELVQVDESDRYLLDTVREEYLYFKSIPIIQKAAELLKTDANESAQFLISSLNDLQPNYQLGGTDIIHSAETRYEQYIERKTHQDEWFFTTGFEALDDEIHGLQRGEELFVLVARTNQGKSWVLEKICVHIWQIGFNVGYISPEMGASSIGYRFDTLHKNFSNKGLMWGKDDVDDTEYKQYIDDLSNVQNRFVVATPREDFDNSITITKLRNWVRQYKLDVLAVDGITYLQDERYKRGDNKTMSLTNISEDLMSLSIELSIPILVVVQSNRGGVQETDDTTPDLENIRDSDGIGFNASKVLSIRQLKNGVLLMEIKKQRFGRVGGKLYYQWDINTGDFQNIPSYADVQPKEKTEQRVKRERKKFNDKEDVF